MSAARGHQIWSRPSALLALASLVLHLLANGHYGDPNLPTTISRAVVSSI
jgi:hypothetical protein